MKKTITLLLTLALLLGTAALPINSARAAGCWLERTRNGYTLAGDSDGVVLTAARSSGSLVDKYGAYPAANAFDGQLRTAWAENGAGYGAGAFVEGAWQAYGGGWKVVGVALWAGYQKNNDIYYKNGRPRDVTLSLYSGGATLGEYALTLDDYQGCQYVYFDNWISLEGEVSARLTLHSAYGGSKYSDTCVSEIDLVLSGADSGRDEYLGDMRVINCNEWVSLRSAPSASATRLAKVPLGAVVQDCQRASAGFVYGVYAGQGGYVKLEYLTPVSFAPTPEYEPEPQPETEPSYGEGELYANSLYALFNGISDAEYRSTMRQMDLNMHRRGDEYASVDGVAVGVAGESCARGNAADFLGALLEHGWYEKGSSGIEPLLERARQVSLAQSECYAWGVDRVTHADEYYRFKVYVPNWGGGYDLYDVIFHVGFEADGGEWAEGKVLSSAHVKGLE